jgi:hypothetical protein
VTAEQAMRTMQTAAKVVLALALLNLAFQFGQLAFNVLGVALL